MLVPGDQPDAATRGARASGAARCASRSTLHSGLADGERRANWRAAANGERGSSCSARGSRCSRRCRGSALIVVDEEHDGSYKQQDGVRYHARDVARLARAGARRADRARQRDAVARKLRERATRAATRALVLHRARRSARALPPVVRARARARRARARRPLAAAARRDRRRGSTRGEQSLVFVNRRGFAPALKCVACAWEAACPRCSARLVAASRARRRCVCHHCGHARARARARARNAATSTSLPAGHGTQRLELALAARFPAARIARVDRDTTRARGAFDEVRVARSTRGRRSTS